MAEALLPLRKQGGIPREMCKVGDHFSGEGKARKLQNSIAAKRIKDERGNDGGA